MAQRIDHPFYVKRYRWGGECTLSDSAGRSVDSGGEALLTDAAALLLRGRVTPLRGMINAAVPRRQGAMIEDHAAEVASARVQQPSVVPATPKPETKAPPQTKARRATR